jgi:hypothetical protein
MAVRLYSCPCCGYPTLGEPPPGTFEICPICLWEDDNVQFEDMSHRGGANVVSLSEARENFAAIGASEPRFVVSARPPTATERAARVPPSP